MADLRQAIQYASQNPDSDFAKFLSARVMSGQADEEARSLGVDLTPIKNQLSSVKPEEIMPQPEKSPVAKAFDSFKSSVVGGLVTGAGKGAVETLQNLGKGTLETLTLGKADTSNMGIGGLEAKTIPEKIGKFGERVAEFIIPASKLTKATAGLKVLPRIATRVAGDIGITTAQSGDIDDILVTAPSSVIFNAMPSLFKVGLNVAKRGSAGLAGKSTSMIDELINNPKMAKLGLTEDIVSGLKQDALKVRNQISKIRKDAQMSYRKTLDSLPEMTDVTKDPVTGKYPYFYSLKGLKSKFTSTLKELGADIDPKKKELSILQTTLPKQFENKLKEVQSTINRWQDFSPAGLDKLAVKLGNYAVKADDSASKLFNQVVGGLKENVRNYIGERHPQAKKMVEDYAKSKNTIKELETYLGKVSTLSNEAEIARTIGKIQTIFTKNKDISRSLLESLQGGEDIIGKQAGREFKEAIQPSTGAIGDKISALIQTILPPSTVAGGVIKATEISNKLKPTIESIYPTLSKYTAQERAVLLETLRGLLSDED